MVWSFSSPGALESVHSHEATTTLAQGERNTSHTILAGTLQGGGRKEWGGNSTSKTPESHSLDAWRKEERKPRYRRTAPIQSRLVEACALGRRVLLVLMGLPRGFCAVMCDVSSVVVGGFGAAG